MGKTKTSAGGIVLSSVLSAIAVLTVSVSLFLNLNSMWPVTAASTGAPAKVEGIEWSPTPDNSSNDQQKEAQAILYGLNEAMMNNDREAFIAWGEGDGQEKLATWWDTTKQVGWEYASVDGENFGHTGHEYDKAKWFFSSELGSRITTLIPEEKGLILTQGEYYNLTLTGMGAEARITSMESDKHYFAWSYLDGDIHVAKRDNSVTVGKAGEKDYIEEKANLVEKAAVKALEIWPSLGGGELPTDGLLAQVSQNQETLDQWLGSNFSPGIEYAGLAVTSARPYFNQPYISPKIATGERTSGSFILMSPRAEGQWSTSYESTLLHEAIHAFHRSAYPISYSGGTDTGGAEGLAVYAQMKHLSPGYIDGTEYYDYVIDYQGIRQGIAAEGFQAFTRQKLTTQDTAEQAYIAAGLAYDYAQQNGIDPWDLAVISTDKYEQELGEIMSELSDGALTSEGYSNFVLNKQF